MLLKTVPGFFVVVTHFRRQLSRKRGHDAKHVVLKLSFENNWLELALSLDVSIDQDIQFG